MQGNYQPFIDRVIHRYEGGYGWNHKDPGGPTNFGITCFDLAEHRGQKMTSMSAWQEPVRNMTLAEAEAIYKTKYATAVHFDTQPAGVDCCLLDYAINSGVGRPLRVVAALPPSVKTPAEIIDAICDERLRFMHAIRGGSAWAEFGHGWGTRVADLRAYCHHLLSEGRIMPPAAPDLTHVVTPKATNVGKTAPKTTAGGAVGGAIAAHTAGFNWWIVGGVTVTVIAAGIAYEAFHDIQAARANKLVHV